VIEGLRGKADADGDGTVLLGELANYTSTEVFRFVDRTRNDEQVPEYVFKANSVPLVERLVPEEITTRVGRIRLKRIPAGSFLMGSPGSDQDAYDDERPQHPVRITRPFYLGVYEVTQGEYEAVMGRNPSAFSAQGASSNDVAGQDTRRHPAENVSW